MLFSSRYDDIYFHPNEAIAEKSHVFQQGNNLISRFTSLCDSTKQKPESFRTGELGFGSGLNFFLTAINFFCHSRASQTLEYYACERHPIKKEIIGTVHKEYTLRDSSLPDFQKKMFHEILDQFLTQMPWPAVIAKNGKKNSNVLQHSFFPENQISEAKAHPKNIKKSSQPLTKQIAMQNEFPNTPPKAKIKLHVFFGDAKDFVEQTLDPNKKIDAWFLDGFAPKKNPDMWEARTFCELGKHSHRHTTVATYSVARTVRDALLEAGFLVVKVPGYGKKRHMLTGTFSQSDK